MSNRKIAIVNRTNLKNFGSVLQVYALCKSVNKLGYDSIVVWQNGNLSRNFDIRPIKIIQTFIKIIIHPHLLLALIKTFNEVKSIKIDEEKVKKFDDFVDKNINQVLYSPQDLIKISRTDTFFKFICGSDQIWCSTTLCPDPLMYLRFAPQNKRIAYAPSLGRDYIPNYNRRILKKYITEIPNVSIREDDGQRLIYELTGLSVPIVADPTLLIPSEEWSNLEKEINVPLKFILCYFLDNPSEDVKNSIEATASKDNFDIVILGSLENLSSELNRIHRPSAGPGEFLYLVKNASMVITDSYHGMLFSIIYKKQFWAIERAYKQYNQSSRQRTVLSRLNLESRYLTSSFNFNADRIDYSAVQKKIDIFVNESLNYLKKAVEDTKDNSPN